MQHAQPKIRFCIAEAERNAAVVNNGVGLFNLIFVSCSGELGMAGLVAGTRSLSKDTVNCFLALLLDTHRLLS